MNEVGKPELVSAEQEVVDLLKTEGPLIQRHVRMCTSLGVKETASVLHDLQVKGIVEKRGDTFRVR